jgi:hypothetical protein
MRFGLLAVATLCVVAPVARAVDPPIVFQMHPADRVLGDLRAAANIVGGEKGVKALNKQFKDVLGEKGFEGLDISRPVVGYVVLAPKPQDITAVVALPITGEKEFLDLCERANKRKPGLFGKEKDVYELPPLDDRYKAVMRFHERHAYIAYGFNPLPHLDPKVLVSVNKLYDPGERGLVAARVHFDRIPLPVKMAGPKLMDEVKRTVLGALRFDRPDAEPYVKAIMPEVEKLAARYMKLAAGADVLAARLVLDIPAGNLVVEATLSGKPNSELSKIIAAWKPTANKFAAIAHHPDTMAAFKLRLPLFEDEIRSAVVAGLEVGQKQALDAAFDNSRAATEELFKGLIRTVKTGEFDIVMGVRGPDKNGWYTGVGAVAFEDPSKLEKEFKAYIEKTTPQDEQARIKWNAAKAGNVNIHTWKVTPGGFIDVTKVFGGDDCEVAYAFAPHGVFGAIGPGAVATLKDALAVKPADSPVFELLANPSRATKLIEKVIGPNDPDIAKLAAMLGKEDKLLSALSIKLEGGAELKATVTVDLKLLPRLALFEEIERQSKEPVKPEPIEKR